VIRLAPIGAGRWARAIAFDPLNDAILEGNIAGHGANREIDGDVTDSIVPGAAYEPEFVRLMNTMID
jgi:hypothetical protein